MYDKATRLSTHFSFLTKIGQTKGMKEDTIFAMTLMRKLRGFVDNLA